LKIADFGLATSGEWIYQESYRSRRRKELLRKYHQSIIDDGGERSLDTPHKASHEIPSPTEKPTLKKMYADSVVGTYYYMAPEVLQGNTYDASADWSLSSPKSQSC